MNWKVTTTAAGGQLADFVVVGKRHGGDGINLKSLLESVASCT